MKGDSQQGILKIKGVVAFNYFYNDLGGKMESVVDGVVVEQLMIEEFVMEFRD